MLLQNNLVVHEKNMQALETIALDPNTTVVIISGSQKSRLQKLFGSLHVWLAAENGTFVRGPNPDDVSRTPPSWLSRMMQENQVCILIRRRRLLRWVSMGDGVAHLRKYFALSEGLVLQPCLSQGSAQSVYNLPFFLLILHRIF